jgi:hypothetical protein
MLSLLVLVERDLLDLHIKETTEAVHLFQRLLLPVVEVVAVQAVLLQFQ